MKIAARVMAVLFLVLLMGMALINLPLTVETLGASLSSGQDLKQISTSLRDAYLTDDLAGKNDFVNLGGLYARLVARREYNDTVRMRNGMLQNTNVSAIDMTQKAEGVSEFAEWLRHEDVAFLYVQLPDKLDLAGDMVPAGFTNGVHQSADSMVQGLYARKVNTLDLRTELCATPERVEKYFYATDHHWNALGAFRGYQMTAQVLQELFPEESILYQEAVQEDNWYTNVKKNQFLGSQGKRVGKYFGGVDDLIWLTPDFDTSMSMNNVKYTRFTSGTFEDAVIQNQYIEDDGSYFEYSHYNVYVGGDYPLVLHRNAQAPVQKKVLIIKDSYVLPYQCFMSTLFTAVDVVDPRYYTAQGVADYVQQSRPDVVIMAVSPSVFTQDLYFMNLLPENNGALVEETVARTDLTVAPAEGAYNYVNCGFALQPETQYRLTFEDVRVDAGDTEAVCVSLYDAAGKKHIERMVFDVTYGQATGDYSWYFETPADANLKLQLLVYPGVPGDTANKGVTVCGAILSTVSYDASQAFVGSRDYVVQPEDDGYHYMATDILLKPDAWYQLTIGDITVTSGMTDAVGLSLYDRTAQQHLERYTLTLTEEGGYSWVFHTPADMSDNGQVLLYAGRIGQTENIGVSFDNVKIQQLDTELQHTQAPAEEAVIPSGDKQAVSGVSVVIPALMDNNYNFAAVEAPLTPGRWQLTIGGVSVYAGQTDALDITVYTKEGKEHLARHVLSLNREGPWEWTFTVPAGAPADARLLIYAGSIGNTADIGVTCMDVSVIPLDGPAPEEATATDLPEETAVPELTGGTVWAEPVSIDAADNAYNYKRLDVQLMPGTAYGLTLEGVSVTGGSGALQVAVYDRASKTYHAQHTFDAAAVSGGGALTWVFMVPAEAENPAELLVYAGERGKTEGVGVTCESLSLTAE